MARDEGDFCKVSHAVTVSWCVLCEERIRVVCECLGVFRRTYICLSVCRVCCTWMCLSVAEGVSSAHSSDVVQEGGSPPPPPPPTEALRLQVVQSRPVTKCG